MRNWVVDSRALLGELDRFPDRRPVVLVEAEDEHAVDLDPLAAENLDRLVDLGHGLLLLHAVEALGIDRLEADVDRVAAGLLHQPDELEVAGDVGPDLGRPWELEPLPDHGLEELLGPLPVGGEVVVVEEDRVAAVVVSAELLDDVLRRAEAVRFAEHAGHGAEGAVERAAARRLDGNGAGGTSGAPGSGLSRARSGYGIASRSRHGAASGCGRVSSVAVGRGWGCRIRGRRSQASMKAARAALPFARG